MEKLVILGSFRKAMGVSWESEVLDLTQMVMVIQKQLRINILIMNNNSYLVNFIQNCLLLAS